MGGEYRIIDKSASIEFVKPGVGSVTANCYLQPEEIEDIIAATKNGDKYFKNFSIDITDQGNEVVARVKRSVYIRKKQ
jgi:hypothetical protein